MKRLFLFIMFFSVNVFAKPVNINSADAQTIADSLNGIGIKKAQAIVDYRAKNGNFVSVDDLSKVSGIGVKTIDKNKADILLSDTPSSDSSKESSNKDTKSESKNKSSK